MAHRLGNFFVAAFEFFKAIFIGAAGKGAAYTFAVNAARVGVLALTARLTQPKIGFTEQAAVKGLTVRDTIAPQVFGYGEDMLSGPLLFANTTGTNNKDLYYLVGMVGHECDSATGYRVDSTDIPLSDLSGSEDGTVDQGKFAGVMEIEFLHGEAAQAVSTLLSGAFSSLWTASHTLRGWTCAVWKMTIDESNEDAFESGVPSSLRAKIKLKKVYDPRLDTSPGNDPTNAAYIAWSDNPALALADWWMDEKFGLDEEADRIDWDKVVTAADICDELVTIPPSGSPATTQKRYTINATFDSTQTRGQVRDQIVGAMLGRTVFSQGKWMMWAGAAITPDVTLDEHNLRGDIQLQASAGSKERNNQVRGKFVDAGRDYTPANYPPVKSTTFLTDDNNEEKWLEYDVTTANDSYEAQRNAIIMLKRGRRFRQLLFQGNWSCFRVQPGSVVNLDCAELGFSGDKYFCTEWRFGENGIDLVLVQENDSDWDDPAIGDYTVRGVTGVLQFADIGVPPTTSFTATARPGAVELNWTNPPRSTFDVVEVWESATDQWSAASKIAEGRFDSLTVPYNTLDARWYWTRVRRGDSTSDRTPDNDTSTITATPINPRPGLPGATKILDYDDLQTNASGGDGRYALLETSDNASGTNDWSIITSAGGIDYIWIDEVDKDAVDQSAYLATLVVGDIASLLISDGKWVVFRITSIETPPGGRVKFGVTYINHDEVDGTGNLNGGAGNDVEWRFSRGEDGDDGDPGDPGIPGHVQTLDYDDADSSGGATSDGSYAFLESATETDGTVQWADIVDGSSITHFVVNDTDENANDKSAVWGAKQVGDLIIWYDDDYRPGRWVAFIITAVDGSPPSGRYQFTVDYVSHFDGVTNGTDNIPTAAGNSVQLRLTGSDGAGSSLTIGDLTNQTLADTETSPNNAEGDIRIHSDGTVDTSSNGGSSWTNRFTWRGNGASGDYEVRITVPHDFERPDRRSEGHLAGMLDNQAVGLDQ